MSSREGKSGVRYLLTIVMIIAGCGLFGFVLTLWARSAGPRPVMAEPGATAEITTATLEAIPLITQTAPSAIFTPTLEPTAISANPLGETTWYFAEGYTADQVKLYLFSLVKQVAEVTYYFPDAEPVTFQHEVPAGTPFAIIANDDVGPEKAIGIRVVAPFPLVAQRVMEGNGSVTTSLGITKLSSTWYFAEGYTKEGFNTVYTILNPSEIPLAVDATYYYKNGTQKQHRYIVEAMSRFTIQANDPAEVGPDKKFTAIFQVAAGEVVMERSMPFAEGALNHLGVPTPLTDWYFAEGDSAKTTLYTFFNPNSTPANVELRNYAEEGPLPFEAHRIPPSVPVTVEVLKDQDVGFATWVASDLPIVAERVIYFGGGGHASEGADEPATTWVFPVGDTRQDESGRLTSSWILAFYPGGAGDTQASFTYYLDTGEVVTVEHTLAWGRSSFEASLDIGSGHLYSLVITADWPIVAEEAIYTPAGGMVTLGYPIP